MRFDRRLSRIRHRHRQSTAGRTARHPAPSHRHRRADRGVYGRAICPRCCFGDPRHPRAGRIAFPRRRHRLLLSRADTRPVPGTRTGQPAARAARGDCHPPRRDVSAPPAQADRPRVGRTNSAARPQTERPRARSVLSDRPAADGTLRSHGVADPGDRGAADRRPAAGGGDVGPRDETRGSAVRARVAGRNPGLARPWHSRNRPSVWRSRLPPGPRASARGPGRGRDARADRAGESPVRPASVDLVPQRA